MNISNNRVNYLDRVKSKNYIYWVDLMRGLGITLIVMGHCQVLPSLFFLTMIWALTIPLFTFLSGYTMFINHSQINNYKSYLKKKLKYIIPNYLIWGTLLAFFDLFLVYINNNQLSDLNDLLSLLINTFFKLLTGNVGIVYFTYILIQFYIIFPLILKIFNNSDKPIIIYILYLIFLLSLAIISMFLIDLIIVSQFSFIIEFNQSLEFPIFYLVYTPISFVFLLYLSFFMLGIICAIYREKMEKISKNNWTIISLIILYIFFFLIIRFTDNDTYIFAFLDGIAISLIVFIAFLAFSRIKISKNIINENGNALNETNIKIKRKEPLLNSMNLKIKKTLWKIGLNSAGIYYTHSFIVFFVKLSINLILSSLNIIPSQNLTLIINIITFITTLIISYLLIEKIRKNIKKSRYIIGI